MTRRRRLLPGACLLTVFATPACLSRPVENPNIIVASLTSGPNNLDPRLGTDDSSARIHQLIFNALVELDDDLRVRPALAERLENPEPHIYVARLRLDKTNFVVAQRTLQGIRLSPVADFFFLKNVVRLPPTAAN